MVKNKKMKIKIRPYPNYKITEDAFNNDVMNNCAPTTNSDVLSNQLIMVTEFENNERRVIKIRPIHYNDNLYLSAFPNPIHLFLSLAIEHYNISESIKSTNFPKCGKRYGDNIYMLDIEENGTHDCYNNYIKYRISSIIMLVSSIEAFLNHVIPNDFRYKTERKGKKVEFNKIEIESAKVSFNEKLIQILPLVSTKTFDWSKLQTEEKIVLNLYENRKNLIHLKTNAADDFECYFDTIDKMLDYDLSEALNSVVKVMNCTIEKFIEFEKDEEDPN